MFCIQELRSINDEQIKHQASEAASKGCYAFKAHFVDDKPWCVYVDGEFGPRGYMTRREAIHLAYAISISKKLKLEVSFE